MTTGANPIANSARAITGQAVRVAKICEYHRVAVRRVACRSRAECCTLVPGEPGCLQSDFFEDENFRVIASTRKKGVVDKEHSHPVPSVTYFLTDCANRIYTPDGKTRDTNEKAGTARAVPIIPSHSTENIGPADCQMLIVERK